MGWGRKAKRLDGALSQQRDAASALVESIERFAQARCDYARSLNGTPEIASTWRREFSHSPGREQSFLSGKGVDRICHFRGGAARAKALEEISLNESARILCRIKQGAQRVSERKMGTGV